MIGAMTPPAAPCYVAIEDDYRSGFYAGDHVRVRAIVREGHFAYVAWRGIISGGQSVFRSRNGRWCKIGNGGGVMNVDDLVRYGVPLATARRLYARMQRTGATR